MFVFCDWICRLFLCFWSLPIPPFSCCVLRCDGWYEMFLYLMELTTKFSSSATYGCPSVRYGDPGTWRSIYWFILCNNIIGGTIATMQQSLFCLRWQQCNSWTTFLLQVLMYYYLYRAKKLVSSLERNVFH